jgi:hypothetical protein
MSNAERQKRFQAANPGYDARRKARERGMAMRAVQRARAAIRAHAAAAANRPVLMLPAPVEDPIIAELNALRASLAKQDDKVMG